MPGCAIAVHDQRIVSFLGVMMHLRCSLLLVLGLLALLGGCSPSQDPDLKQAVQATSSMGKARHLQRSCFYLIHPQGQPSDFVGYLFSDLGVAEWPIAIDPDEAAGMKAAGIPPLPEGVGLSPGQRQHRDRKELVLTGNDAAGQVEIMGYLPNADQPNIQATFPLAVASPDDFTQQLCQSALESGINPGIVPDPSLAPAPVPTP